MLQMTGDGNSFLANDGTYKNIEVPTMPSKVSELENDCEYITVSELNTKGYCTEQQVRDLVELILQEKYSSGDDINQLRG
jgi:hypothetical protein